MLYFSYGKHPRFRRPAIGQGLARVRVGRIRTPVLTVISTT
jgi:hypothetical protein